ncbi:pyrrolidone-carboxylate peptidase [Natronococcus amylolyticus DSM 10524]|uniref:Pyroglutamyl-peptidase I n=1 Tax=Natronococcus amylolyticus DSM 10524 TaxID=1227497 RepID=L9XJ13_9EURY|nr:pyrrolidone-carboxylate peptidase [Natronococcus amylolyticus DSM 10524]
MSDVLLTGYEPFGEFETNPARRLATRLDGTEIGGASVAGVELPVVFDRASSRLEEAVGEHDPEIVCALGLAGGRSTLSLERVGINLRDTRGVADNEDREVVDERVAADGPDAYFATLPCREMKAAMCDAGVPTRLSTDAGTHCSDFLPRLK